MKEIKKPTSVAREDFLNDLIKLVNESELPMFVVEPILQNLLNEVRIVMQNQYAKEREQYESALREANNENESSEK